MPCPEIAVLDATSLRRHARQAQRAQADREAQQNSERKALDRLDKNPKRSGSVGSTGREKESAIKARREKAKPMSRPHAAAVDQRRCGSSFGNERRQIVNRCFVGDCTISLAADERKVGDIISLSAKVSGLEHSLGKDVVKLKPVLCARMVEGNREVRSPILSSRCPEGQSAALVTTTSSSFAVTSSLPTCRPRRSDISAEPPPASGRFQIPSSVLLGGFVRPKWTPNLMSRPSAQRRCGRTPSSALPNSQPGPSQSILRAERCSCAVVPQHRGSSH